MTHPDDNIPFDANACPDFSQAILSQLTQDQAANLPCEYTLGFVSAYLDRSLWLEDPHWTDARETNFEIHLVQCSPCNQVLGALQTGQDLVRHYWLSQEAALQAMEWPAMMIAHPEPIDPLNEDLEPPTLGCGLYDEQSWSLLADQALPAARRADVLAHTQDCSDCALVLQTYTVLSALTHRALLQAEKDIPDCWPAIKQVLQQPTKVIPFPNQTTPKKPSQSGKSLRIAVGTGIAAGLIMGVMLPQILPAPWLNKTPSINVAALESALRADWAEKKAEQEVQSPVVDVAYSSPESYLASPESDPFNSDVLQVSLDPVAVALPAQEVY